MDRLLEKPDHLSQLPRPLPMATAHYSTLPLSPCDLVAPSTSDGDVLYHSLSMPLLRCDDYSGLGRTPLARPPGRTGR